MRLNLPLYSYQLRSRPSSPARLVNCFPELLPAGAATPVMITRSPGITEWITVGTGHIEAMYQKAIEFEAGRQDYLYVVSGDEWYYVDSAGSKTLIGNIGTPNRIDMSSNQTTITLVNEPKGFYWNGVILTGTHTGSADQDGTSSKPMVDSAATFTEDALIGYQIRNTTDGSIGTIIDNDETTVTVKNLLGGTDNDFDASDAYVIVGFGEITDDDFVSRGSGDVEYLDKFYFHREPNSNRFFIGPQWSSGETDDASARSFDSLQYVEVDDAPDELTGLLAHSGLMLAFGNDTLEFYENTGVAGVPFERIINSTVEVGCLDPKGIARVFNKVHFVADDYTVRRLDGLIPMRVSTHAIEQRLAAETIVDSFSYSQEGHFFYCLTTTGGTYLLDAITSEWSERESYGLPNWTPRHHAQFAGYELMGDSNTNKIGYLDFTSYKEFGNTQRMEWTYQPVWANGVRAFHNRLEIVLETGVGLTTGQGDDPKIMLQYSDDGGLTWQSMPDRTFGKRGETETRCVWNNLGSARKRVYRAACSDPVPITITDTLLEVEGGRL